jgi:WD40 repeat protein
VVFDLDTDGAPKRLANEPSGFQAVRFLDQDRLVGVCRVLHVWQWKTGDTEQVFRAWNAEDHVWLSGDGGWAAVQDGDRVTLWDTAFGNAGVTINGRVWAGGAHAVAFSPDARRIATTTRGEAIHVYETATGKEVLQFASPDRRVASMTFSPDGNRLATGMDDGTVMLWDTAESTRN